MSDVIRLLPEHVANQIAAGEVVQRPASVVKELMENSIDAGADTIKLLVKDAGKSLIQVIDNGVGMSHTDARMSFERHATSKIRTATDLYGIRTNGFRGEALASIAAVAHVEMRTRTGEDELGTKIIIQGSEIVSQEHISTPKGTSIAVKNLFFNIPARRNFLKSDKVEMRHIINEFQRVALAYPEISFHLYHNDSEIYHLPSGNRKQRIVQISGKKSEEKWIPLHEHTAIVNIEGFIGKPAFAKKIRGEQFFFVNKRFIKSPYLHHAVKNAYSGLIPEGRQPAYFIYLEIPPEKIDINIHPSKTEIKFEEEKEIYSLLLSAVKHSLGQYQATPALDFDRDPNLDLPYDYMKKKQASPPKIHVDRNFNPFKHKGPEPSWETLYQDTSIPASPVQNETSFPEDIPQDPEVAGNTIFPENEIQARHYNIISLQNKYLLTRIKSGIAVIHRRRAHERILYEGFLRKLTQGEVRGQKLLFPVKIPVSQKEKHLLEHIQSDMENCGFSYEMKDDELIVHTTPPLLPVEEVEQTLIAILSGENDELPGDSFSYTDYIAKLLAFSTSLHTGQSADEQEYQNLVDELFRCKEPHISPSGKPTYTILTVEQIDKLL